MNDNNTLHFNRCIGLTKNNKRCRAKINCDKLFCSNSHYPFNADIVEDCCFICQEKVKTPNEILFFKCRHAFHKPCFIEWLQYSTYENIVCLYCRSIVCSNQRCEKQQKIIKNIIDITPLIKISEILKNNN